MVNAIALNVMDLWEEADATATSLKRINQLVLEFLDLIVCPYTDMTLDPMKLSSKMNG